MKIVVCPADEGGCGHYRMIWPARALAAQGFDVRVLEPHERLCAVGYDAHDRVAGIAEGPDADVVVLQRVLSRDVADLIPHLQAQGIAVVVEIDDDFSRVDPNNIAAPMSDPALSPDRNWHHLKRAAAAADFVTVSTPALARRFAPHGRVAVLENCVPDSYLDQARTRALAGTGWAPGKKLRVGWSGSTKTHPGDLETTGGALDRCVGGLASFHVVGPGYGVRAALKLADKPTASGWVELADYPRALSLLDIGIVALKPSPFNRAKSWLKGLEMAAVGVPFVASNTPEYERLAKLGAGRLAARPQDWYREVQRLIHDVGARQALSEAGLATAGHFTVEANAHRWLAAWTEAATIRRAA